MGHHSHQPLIDKQITRYIGELRHYDVQGRKTKKTYTFQLKPNVFSQSLNQNLIHVYITEQVYAKLVEIRICRVSTNNGPYLVTREICAVGLSYLSYKSRVRDDNLRGECH